MPGGRARGSIAVAAGGPQFPGGRRVSDRRRADPGGRLTPDPDLRTFVILTAGLAGFHPSKRQPMSGTRELWQDMTLLSGAVLGRQAMRDRRQEPWGDGDGNGPSQV